jgi:N-acetylglucosaminyl-diphospho-decaprenol L-rhamnosyltransferase
MNASDDRPDVDVVVVNWNTGPYLARCLESLAACEGRHRLHITVVDNASTDGSADCIKTTDQASRVRLMRNTVNVGFAAACNQGAKGGGGNFVLLLNPDAVVSSNAIQHCLDFLASHAGASAGICGGAVVDESDQPAFACARFPSLRSLVGKVTGLTALAPRMFPPHHMSAGELDRTRQVDQVIGAFYFVRRCVWETLGGFDESFFMYYEEVDFARRALDHGWTTWYLDNVRVIHAGNVSSRQVRSARTFYSLRSRAIYARRHWSPAGLASLILLSLSVEPVARLLQAAKAKDWVSVRETVTSYQRYARTLPHVLMRGTG